MSRRNWVKLIVTAIALAIIGVLTYVRFYSGGV